MARSISLGGLALGTALVTGVAAQPTTEEFAALRCYQQATAENAITGESARELCLGAGSTAPAACFATVKRQAGVTDLAAVQVCRGATDPTAPAACLQQLQRDTSLPTNEAVTYCAARALIPVPPGGGGDPACVDYALDHTQLTSLDALRVCAGSTSTEPARCVEWGEDHLRVDHLKLVSLCAPVVWVHGAGVWTPYR